MTIEECYAALGGNYQQALGRLMNDALIKRFVLKFPSDKSYDNMVAAINACDTDTATYRRFMVGFKTALRIDRGKGVPEEVYQRFINY